jgi:RNA polymerase-binding transcription factor DksA
MAIPIDPAFPDDDLLPDAHEVYDEADQASMIQMAENKQALAKVKARLAPETHPDFDGKNCIDCGDKIPKARLDMGRMRCVHCQTSIEQKGRMFAPKREE